MKKKAIAFNPEELVRSVEQVRDAVTGRIKLTLRTTKLPAPAPAVTPQDVARIRARLKVSQPVFAAMLNVPVVMAISWEKGRRQPSGAALRCWKIAREHPETLAGTVKSCSLTPIFQGDIDSRRSNTQPATCKLLCTYPLPLFNLCHYQQHPTRTMPPSKAP